MPSVTAKRKCPELIFVKPRFEVYRSVSQQIRAIFAEYTPIIEPLSLDEAYLDVTENFKAMPSATEIGEEIRGRIRSETSLTASAGVSYNKFLAKMASDERKPDGLFVITPKAGPAFVEGLPVGKFHGIGPVTAARMEGLGIHNGGDLRSQTLAFLQHHFGKVGPYYYSLARASTTARSALIASVSRSVPRQHSMPTSSRPRRPRPPSNRSSPRCGPTAKDRRSGAGRRRSRSNTLTSGRSPAAGPSRSRSPPESYSMNSCPRSSIPSSPPAGASGSSA